MVHSPDIALGIVGGIIGGWVLQLFGFYTTGGLIPSILVAIFGAVILILLVRACGGDDESSEPMLGAHE